ncbi:MAG TPA: hypothetical protein VNW94_25845 [Streptosporangiaceae bacterium]|nr:hypothetical protein [Streptosporangiaceae bacterium]
MSAPRRGRIDRATAEQMLSGDLDRPDALSVLLAAAATPPSGGELAGEAEALAVFRVSGSAAPIAFRRPARAKAALAGLLTYRAAVAAFATAVVIGGVALMAANVGGGAKIVAVRSPEATTQQPTPSDAPTTTTHRPSPRGTVRETVGTGQPAVQQPLLTLCSAALTRAEHGDFKSAPSALVKAAGGQDKVFRYCIDLLVKSRIPHSGDPLKPPWHFPSLPPGLQFRGH